MHHLPDIKCIYSINNCNPEEVESIINEIKFSPRQALSDILLKLEGHILAQKKKNINSKSLDRFEIAIGEMVARYKSVK